MTKKNTELESGKIKISEDVYATIVTMAALETKGIHHMSSTFNDGVNTFFRRKSDHEGVKISFNDEELQGLPRCMESLVQMLNDDD